jgi:hypothetical protein
VASQVAKASEQFRQSDVTFWAVAALCLWAVALLSGVMSAIVPSPLFQSLHSSRLDNASIADLSRTLAQLSAASTRLKDDNAAIAQRLLLREQADTAAVQRLAALEQKSTIIAGTAEHEPIDTIITASTGTSPVKNFSTKGGSVSYQTSPLPDGTMAVDDQPLPAPLSQAVADPNAFGVALGPPVSDKGAGAAWGSMNARVGTLLVGLSPLLGRIEASNAKHLIAGPLRSEAEAQALCGRMAQVGIACSTASFMGDAMSG